MNTSVLPLLLWLLLPGPAHLYSIRHCIFPHADTQTLYCYDPEILTIPPEIPKSVVNLLITFTKVEKILKDDFRGLDRLQSLDLNSNNISHIENGAFSHLTALSELNLSGNRLSKLTDATFEGLSNVTTLELKDNDIETISESVFSPLLNLQRLHLSGNRLSRASAVVSVFSSCPWLHTLELRHNLFTSFESESFPFPLSVSELSLRRNPLHTFKLYSDLLPHLEILDLSEINIQLQWDVLDKAFLKNLKTLDLSKTNFTAEIYQSIFSSAHSLQMLDLSNSVRILDRDLLDLVCGIPTLQKLNLASNSIPILDDDLVRSCTSLTDLDLSRASMTDASEWSLRTLTRLSKLNMKRNRLSRVPLTIRNMSSLTSLSFLLNRITELHCLDFSELWQLTELNLAYNKLVELNSCVFKDLHSLQQLDVRNNFILQFDDSLSGMLPNLLTLDANRNNLAWLQKGVFKNMTRLTKLSFDSVRETNVEEGAWEGLSDLKELSYSPAPYIPETNTGPGSNLASGGRSHLSKIINLPSLHKLKLTIHVEACFHFTQRALQGLDNLLDFSAINFFCLSPDKETFHDTSSLQKLSIQNNHFCPTPELFHPITHLKTLDLSDANIFSLNFLSQSNLTQLQTLVLKNNHLIVINETIFQGFPSLKYLDLSKNPFVCNCSNAGFIHWALTNQQVYVFDAFNYRCASPLSAEGDPLLDFDVQGCRDDSGFICFLCSSVLILVTLSSTFTYHFLRWHMVYAFYFIRAFAYDVRKQRQGCAEVYDAFVSYNVLDEEWVYQELIPELEERQGWRLCLHHRDFEPGRAIMDNITDAIYSSRKTLCVISRHYLQSEWCSHELQMASFRLLDEKKDVLILLLLEEISPDELSPFYRMRKLLRRSTYLSWSGARSHRGLFWERIRRALQSGADISANNPLGGNEEAPAESRSAPSTKDRRTFAVGS